MHPFVRLMRTYCVDYTNSHDQTIYDEFMDPTYVVNSFGVELPRVEAYAPGVQMIFETAPGLGLVVHELVLNGDRLAMHFSDPDPSAEGVVRSWLERGDLTDAPDVEIDDSRVDGIAYEAVLDVDDVVVDDIFSAGGSVPFHITVRGGYRGGLGPACDAHVGSAGEMGIAGIARVANGGVAKVEAVTCRIQAISSVTGGPLELGF